MESAVYFTYTWFTAGLCRSTTTSRQAVAQCISGCMKAKHIPANGFKASLSAEHVLWISLRTGLITPYQITCKTGLNMTSVKYRKLLRMSWPKMWKRMKRTASLKQMMKVDVMTLKMVNISRKKAWIHSWLLKREMLVCVFLAYDRADSRFAPSQWETALLRNDVSHWLGASLESALIWSWWFSTWLLWLNCVSTGVYSFALSHWYFSKIFHSWVEEPWSVLFVCLSPLTTKLQLCVERTFVLYLELFCAI